MKNIFITKLNKHGSEGVIQDKKVNIAIITYI